jgi:serine/threonine protein kinase
MGSQTPEPARVRSAEHEYVVDRALGEGGQGKTLLVHRADAPGQSYVLKQLRLEHADDWKQIELFEREVTTLAALSHPGIPRLVDRIVEDGRTSGIVQTYVEGHTVAAQIAERGTMDARRFERLLRESLEILAVLRAQVPPVLHRDINPKNVMIGDRAYLIDFGAVRVGGKTDMTSVGTFGYMAPEQIIGRPGPASDMYGLGMTFVSLAEGRDVGDLAVDPATGQLDRDAVLRDVQPRVRDVVLAMIEPGLGARLGDPSEALRRLDAPPTALAVVAPTQALAVRSKPPFSVPALAVGAGLLVLAALGAVLALSSAPPAPPQTPAVVQPAPPPPAPVPAPIRAPAPPVPAAPKASPARPPAPAPEPVATAPVGEGSAELHIRTTPSDVAVAIDGVDTCRSPCTVAVSYGEHEVVVRHGGRHVDRTVRVLADTELNIVLREP